MAKDRLYYQLSLIAMFCVGVFFGDKRTLIFMLAVGISNLLLDIYYCLRNIEDKLEKTK